MHGYQCFSLIYPPCCQREDDLALLHGSTSEGEGTGNALAPGIGSESAAEVAHGLHIEGVQGTVIISPVCCLFTNVK